MHLNILFLTFLSCLCVCFLKKPLGLAFCSLRKLAHAINRDFLALKNENSQLEKNGYFSYSCQNKDCGHTLEPPRQGGSNEYPQSMF